MASNGGCSRDGTLDICITLSIMSGARDLLVAAAVAANEPTAASFVAGGYNRRVSGLTCEFSEDCFGLTRCLISFSPLLQNGHLIAILSLPWPLAAVSHFTRYRRLTLKEERRGFSPSSCNPAVHFLRTLPIDREPKCRGASPEPRQLPVWASSTSEPPEDGCTHHDYTLLSRERWRDQGIRNWLAIH